MRIPNKFTIPEQQQVYKKIGHDSMRLTKWLAYFDRYYENIKLYDLIAAVCSTFK